MNKKTLLLILSIVILAIIAIGITTFIITKNTKEKPKITNKASMTKIMSPERQLELSMDAEGRTMTKEAIKSSVEGNFLTINYPRKKIPMAELGTEVGNLLTNHGLVLDEMVEINSQVGSNETDNNPTTTKCGFSSNLITTWCYELTNNSEGMVNLLVKKQ